MLSKLYEVLKNEKFFYIPVRHSLFLSYFLKILMYHYLTYAFLFLHYFLLFTMSFWNLIDSHTNNLLWNLKVHSESSFIY